MNNEAVNDRLKEVSNLVVEVLYKSVPFTHIENVNEFLGYTKSKMFYFNIALGFASVFLAEHMAICQEKYPEESKDYLTDLTMCMINSFTTIFNDPKLIEQAKNNIAERKKGKE